MAKHARSTMRILQSSIFMMGSTALTAGLGFLFWGLVAHHYSTDRVGLATSLLSALSLISYLGLLGLNNTVVRFPAPARSRNSQLTLSMTVTGTACALIGGAYLAAIDWISPGLSFVHQNTWFTVAFLLFCSFAGINLLTDSVFVAARIPQYNMVVDGIIQSLAKLAMPIFLVTLGSAGIVTASGIGYVVAVIASIAAMRWRLKFRFDLRTRGTRLREQARFSVASYLASVLNLLPLLALPSIALHDLGAQASAVYFMAFQIANMLNTAGHSIGSAMFSEASHDPSKTAESLRRAARLMAMIVVPAALVVMAGGGLLLGIFGPQYESGGRSILAALAAGSIAVAFNTWASNTIQLLGRLRPLVASNVVFTVLTIGLAALWAPHGLIWLAYAWGLGNLVSGLVAVVYVPRGTLSAAPKPADAGAGAAEATGADEAVRPSERPAYRPAPASVVDDAPTLPLMLPWNLSDDAWSKTFMAVRPRAESPHPPAPEATDAEW